MLRSIFQNWSFFRFLRLAMGMLITIQGILLKDWLFAVAGLLFTGMAVFNTGCCSTGTCSSPGYKKTEHQKETTYEEVV